MIRARNTEQKRSKTPSQSRFKSAPVQVMVPRLMVIISTVFLVVVGLVMVYSASSITAMVEEGDSFGEALKQLIFVGAGLVGCAAAIYFFKDRDRALFVTAIFWVICFLGVIATAFVGTAALGAKRWILIGGMSIQFSEFMKIAIVLMTARVASEYQDGLFTPGQAALRVAIFALLPMGLVFILQSDMGTTIITFVAVLVVIYQAGFPRSFILTILAVALVVAFASIIGKSYRADRLATFMDPWSDAQGTGYQLIHSYKALAAGGLLGLGVGNSYEKLLYLPEAETDFIFAIVGEEMGLIGTAAVIIAFLLFLYGSFKIAEGAQSSFHGIAVAALAVMVVFQAFLNISCVVGLVPTTGKPLPFISSGGSSMMSSLIIVGLIMAVSLSQDTEEEPRQRRENLRVVSSFNASPASSGQRNGARRDMVASGSPRNSSPMREGASYGRSNRPARTMRR